MVKATVSKFGAASAALAYGPSQMMVEGQVVYIADEIVSHGFDGPEVMAVVQFKLGLQSQYIFPKAKLDVAA